MYGIIKESLHVSSINNCIKFKLDKMQYIRFNENNNKCI